MAERKFDTSRFKGTNMSTLKQQDQEMSRSIGQQDRGRAGMHEIEEGTNYFRIYPHHAAVLEMAGEDVPEIDRGETFAENRVIYYVPLMVQDKDDKGVVKKDGKGRDIMKEVNKSVFDSRVHGGTPKDVIDEYIKFVKAYAAATIKNDADRTKFLEPIEGNWGKKIGGLKAIPTWIVYADKIIPKGKDASGLNQVYERKFGRLEFGKAVRIGLESVAAQEQSNQPLGTDPFTDPAEGIAIQIIYNKHTDKPQEKYSVGQYAPKLGGGRIQLFSLEEEQLNKLLEHDSLTKLYKNVYKRKDFDIALKGLQLFDTKYDYNMLNHEDFVPIMEDIASYYPIESNETNVENPAEEQTGGEGEVGGGSETNDDQFTLMNRTELKDWHKKNKTGLIVLPKHTDDNLREMAREFVEGSETEQQQQVDTGGVEKNENITKTEKKPKTAAEMAKEKLLKLKKK